MCGEKGAASMLRATRVLEEFRRLGITHVAGLPDNSSAALFSLLECDTGIRLVPVTREGEAFAVSAGLWIGGANPVVLIQNTGLLESGDSLRGTALRMRIPLLCLVTYRGYASLGLRTSDASDDGGADRYSRAGLDSVAVLTEPTLRAWGIPFDFLHDAGDIEVLDRNHRRAREESRPVAVLITGRLG